MPDISLEQALKEAYACAPSDVVILHTLEFRHPNFVDETNQPTAIRVVLDHVDHTLKLEASAPVNPSQYVTFIRFAFDFTLPEVQNSAAPEIIILMDNVSRDIEDNLALAAASPYKVEVTYRPYLNNDDIEHESDYIPENIIDIFKIDDDIHKQYFVFDETSGMMIRNVSQNDL